MKILNKNKIIVSALALAIGASLAGSISGTVAWYQYSTRANVAFIGEAGGFSGNLQMRFARESDDDNAWRTRITWQEMNDELEIDGYADKIVPMTYGRLDKDAALPADGYIQPLAGQGDMTKWVKAGKKNYARFNLQVRYQERTNGTAANVAKDVYLTKMLIQEDAKSVDEHLGDLTDAVRVHISATDGTNTKNRLISNLGKEVETKGKLDLDNDDKPDQAYENNDEFGFSYKDDTFTDRSELKDIIYGDDGNPETRDVQSSYCATCFKEESGIHYSQEEIDAATDPNDPAYGKTTDDWATEPKNQALVYSENNVLYENSDKESLTANRAIGKTVASETSYLNITVTIWIEGWQKLNGSAIWTPDYIKSMFNVGIQFGVQDVNA